MENEINEPNPTQAVPNKPVEASQNNMPKMSIVQSPWVWVRFGLVAFCLMLFYIYNQHHANKALRKKEILTRELKELRSEKISLESEVTNSSKQSELVKKLEGTGVKELVKPPYKIEYQQEKK